MPSIDTILQEIMDLASAYSRLPTPAMHARDEACKSLQNELRRELGEAPVSVASSGLDVSVGGRQGSYSPLAWVRIYSEMHSPSATAGIYLAYLFAADGSRVYLSLQQGSSEVRSGRMRPVNDPSRLLENGADARSAIRDLIDSPLGTGTTISMDLAWRGLSSVGSYSKQRIRNYEYANILAVEYASGSIPAVPMLLQDLYRMLQFLAELYGDVLPAPSRRQSTGNLVPEAPDSSTSRVQALLQEAATRRAVEVYAEDNAELYFQELDWKVKRVGSEKRGYDLECINDQGETLHVEVKGTQSMGEEVFLTKNEACHNGLLPQCDASHALYVLSGIKITGATRHRPQERKR